MSGMRLSMRVWDLPVRLFHWLVPLLLIALYVTQATHHFAIHVLLGETMAALIVFRIVWGFVGSDTARFAGFLRPPAAAVRALGSIRARGPDNQIGHDAAGGWWVMVLLTLLAVQVLSGLFGSDDGTHGGPLFHLLPAAAAKVVETVHAINFYVLLAAIAVHLLAIGSYAAAGRNLVRPMITGKKRMPAATRAPRMASPVLALLVFGCAAGLILLVINGWGR